MSSCTAELPLSSPDTNPEDKSEIPNYFDNFDILLIYSNIYSKIQNDKNLTIFASHQI